MANSISGNAGTGGATVSYSGTASGSVTADALGAYTIAALAAGPYTITPSLTGYTFAPTSSAQTIVSTDITGVNFTAAITPVGRDVWTKWGVILPPIASDVSGGGLSGTSNETALYEANPQLISANSDGKVWKSWFTGRNNLYYAESNDCLNWTRQAAALIANVSVTRVFKNAGTYYAYAGETPWSTIEVYTSSDGVTFTHIQTALTHSASGWDKDSVYYLSPFYFDGTTWYATYTGVNSVTPGLGLATSPDLLTWTNAASVFTGSTLGFFGAPRAYTVGSRFYLFGGLITGGGQYPDQGSVMSAPVASPPATWSSMFYTIQRTLGNEGVLANAATGNIGPSNLVEVNGTTYCFWTSTAREDLASGYQVCMATAPFTIAQLVTMIENVAPTGGIQLGYDDFIRGSYPDTTLSGGNWTKPATASALPQIITAGLVEPTATSTVCAATYTGVSLPNDQWCEIAFNTPHSQSSPKIFVRGGADMLANSYQLVLTGAAFAKIYKVISGSFTLLTTCAAAGGQTAQPVQNDIWRLSVRGTTITAYQNGVAVGQATGQTDFTSGNTGFQVYDTLAITQSQFSFFRCGAVGNTVSGNAGVRYATVSYTGTASGSTTADSAGNWSLNLVAGSYTITPTLTGRTFSPANSAQTVSASDIFGVNFTATASGSGGGSSSVGPELIGVSYGSVRLGRRRIG